MSNRDAIVRKVFWCLAASPIVWICVFYSYVLRARVRLGTWPRPYRPDPADLNMFPHDVAVLAVFAAAALAMVPLFISLFARRWFGLSGRGWLTGLAIYVAGALAAVGVLWLDVGHFFEWYMD